MALSRSALLFGSLAALVALSSGHGRGAPTTACSSLVPDHKPSPNIVEGGSAPYIFNAPAQATAGSVVPVEIGGAPFKGFMIRAMNSQGCTYRARFDNGNNYQTRTCSAPHDTVTHRGPTDYNNGVQTPWQAPCVPGTYRLMATIVQNYGNIYTGYYKDVTVTAPAGAQHACGETVPDC